MVVSIACRTPKFHEISLAHAALYRQENDQIQKPSRPPPRQPPNVLMGHIPHKLEGFLLRAGVVDGYLNCLQGSLKVSLLCVINLP